MAFLNGKGATEGELKFLLGLPLFQVCIGANEVILNFDEDVSITVESTISFHDAGGHKAIYSPLQSAALALVKLLSSKIDGLSLDQDGTLSLHFGTGDTLIVHKDPGPYESYHVKRQREVYIV